MAQANRKIAVFLGCCISDPVKDATSPSATHHGVLAAQTKAAITSKIKHAIKHKTSPTSCASLVGLVLSSIAYFILLVIAP